MNFVKMEATGNDFILLDGRREEADWPSLARGMCHRHFGVGADGLLVYLPSPKADAMMRMFNPDGSEAEACGNGFRCFSKYLAEEVLPGKPKEVTIDTIRGLRRARLTWEGDQAVEVTLSMGIPSFRAKDVPVRLDLSEVREFPLRIGDWEGKVTCLSMGNPHAVAFLEHIDSFPLATIGPKVEHHPLFPQRINFEVVERVSRRVLRARVWERGAGETLSCGSGACAIAAAAFSLGYIAGKVDIMFPGGKLSVAWDGKGEIFLRGPARKVFRGEWPEGGSP